MNTYMPTQALHELIRPCSSFHLALPLLDRFEHSHFVGTSTWNGLPQALRLVPKIVLHTFSLIKTAAFSRAGVGSTLR